MPHESRALKALDGLLADVDAGSVDKKLSRYERMKRKVAKQGGAKVLVDFEFARPIPPQPYLCQFVHQWLDFRLPEPPGLAHSQNDTLGAAGLYKPRRGGRWRHSRVLSGGGCGGGN